MSKELLTVEQKLTGIFLSHRALIKIAVMSCGIALLAVTGLFICLLQKKPENRYFASTVDGKLFETKALSEPLLSKQAVEGFAGQTLTQTFTFDFINFKSQLETVADRYTAEALTAIRDSLQQEDGLVTKAVTHKWIVKALITAAPTLLQSGFLPHTKTFAWRLEFPLLLTYYQDNTSSTQRFTVRVTVSRVDERNNPRGIAISTIQLLPVYG